MTRDRPRHASAAAAAVVGGLAFLLAATLGVAGMFGLGTGSGSAGTSALLLLASLSVLAGGLWLAGRIQRGGAPRG